MKPMEITIPAESSEVTLKTGGKYCNKDIVVKNTGSFKILTGTLELTEDASTVTLDIAPGAKIVEIIAVGKEQSDGTILLPDKGDYPVQYIYCSEDYQKNVPDQLNGKGALVAYYSKTNARMAFSTFAFSTENGLSIDLSIYAMFLEGGFTYTYKAYYWD